VNSSSKRGPLDWIMLALADFMNQLITNQARTANYPTTKTPIECNPQRLCDVFIVKLF
jgi:hypothetical protein